MSTGMGTAEEISAAINTMRKTKNKKLVLMQCTTNYPAKLKDSNLLVLAQLKKNFKTIMGYSDHTLNDVSAIISVALGARVIEKHFTLSKKMKGPDHSCSLEPKELKEYIKNIRIAELSLGSKIKKPSLDEKRNLKIVRRSVYSKKFIKMGSKLKLSMLEFMRPYDGIEVAKINDIMRRKTTRDIAAYSKLKWSDFE